MSPEARKPSSVKLGSLEMSKSLAAIDTGENTESLTHSQAVPGPVVAAVRVARTCLMDAQFRLSDHGQECDLLNRLQGGAAVLLSVWQGRTVPAPEVPAWIADAAAAWRDERDRRSRR